MRRACGDRREEEGEVEREGEGEGESLDRGKGDGMDEVGVMGDCGGRDDADLPRPAPAEVVEEGGGVWEIERCEERPEENWENRSSDEDNGFGLGGVAIFGVCVDAVSREGQTMRVVRCATMS